MSNFCNIKVNTVPLDSSSANHRLSVSIVLYRPNLGVLRSCLEHLNLSCTKLTDQKRVAVWLVDNSHTPEWQQRIQSLVDQSKLNNLTITYLAKPSNPGYGAGNNIALMQTTAQYHLVLNPDVYMEADCLQLAVGYMQQHPRCVHLAPATFFPNGEIQPLCRRNISLKTQFLRSFAPAWLKKVFGQRLLKDEYLDHDYKQAMHNVEFLSGCFMLLKTAVAQNIGGFDEKYFMYVEDADLTRRLLAVGDNIYYPKARIVHQWERQSYKMTKLTLHHIWSSLYYWWKFR